MFNPILVLPVIFTWLPIIVPSLAERRDDIPELVFDLLNKLDISKEDLPKFNPEAITALTKHNWPGNVRELKNLIERACVLFAGRAINSEHVKNNLLKIKVPEHSEESTALWDAAADLVGIQTDSDSDNLVSPLPHPDHYKDWFSYFENIDLRRHLQDIEIVLIEAALEKSTGQVSQASGMLKLRRTTLIEKMKKLAIEKPSN